MGHLGPVQARYDVLPVPALTSDDVAAAGGEPAEASPATRPVREPSTEPATAATSAPSIAHAPPRRD
jgi:hypothetical protein